MVATRKFAATITLPSDRELVITREFNAPRRLLWEALTKPEHVKRWYGLRAFTMTICEMDVRPGGAWRWGQSIPNGGDVIFSGVYREIVPPEKVVTTEGWEAMPGHEYVSTLTLEEHDGKTTLTNHLLYQTAADRDGHLQSGMEGSMNETYDRLEELLPTL
jgi:uncharacterized protein YndB with AHSA1/START domain